MIVLTENETYEQYSFSDDQITGVGKFHARSPVDDDEEIKMGTFEVRTTTGRKFEAVGTIQDYDRVLKAIFTRMNRQ